MIVIAKVGSGLSKSWLASGCDKDAPWFTTLYEQRMEFSSMLDAIKFSKGFGECVKLQKGECLQIEEEIVRKLAHITCEEVDVRGVPR